VVAVLLEKVREHIETRRGWSMRVWVT